ncbi:MAG: hypothetical protein HY899_09770 [Deltaproteobacteria bacterium]|nr:hypothetical protein [Deltaproteobacteria bacterium]
MKKFVVAIAAGALGGMLCSPAVHAQGAALDHLICYRMQDKLLPKATVDMLANLQPEFTQKGCVIGKPIQFCVPAAKTNVQPPPVNPNIVGQSLDDDYICYQAKCPNPTPPPSKLIVDQFGKRQQRAYKPSVICVPAKKTVLGCGFLGTSKVCGGTCPDPTATCGIDTAGQCNCTPKNTCDGRPDKAGACGGTCPDPDLRCLPDVTSATSNAPVCRCKKPVPPVCGITADGVCGGTCPNLADKCAMDAVGQCTCQSLPAPCAMNTADRTCGGACPHADQTCLPDTATNACSCQPPAACGQDPTTGTCAGDCPTTGDLCLFRSDGTCACQPQPCASDAAGICGGACQLPGQQCQTDATGACNCVPAPCGGDVSACSGACPTGKTCGVVVGTPLDYCGCQ